MMFNETTATMKSRRSLLTLLAIATAFPLATEGVVVPRPAAAAKQAVKASRLVELPRNGNEHVQDGHISNIYNSNDGASSYSSSSSSLVMGEEDDNHLVVRSSQSSTERLVELPRNQLAEHALSTFDDIGILPSPPSFASSDKQHQQQQRHLPTTTTTTTTTNIIDGTTSTITYTTNALRQSLDHEKLLTSYNGNIPSSSLEFTLRNHRSDGRYVVLGGLGLNAHVIPGVGESGDESVCRVRVYTRRLGDIISSEEDDDDDDDDDGGNAEPTEEVPPAAAEYQEALDAKVLCAGRGKETLLSSDLFLKYYRWKEQELHRQSMLDAVAGSIAANGISLSLGGGGRKLKLKEVADRTLEEGGDNVENLEHGTITGISANVTNTTNVTVPEKIYGLTPEDKLHPLVIAPNEALSVYIILEPAEETPSGTTFYLLSSAGSAEGGAAGSSLGTTTVGEPIEPGALYITDPSLQLHEGTSIINGSLVKDEALEATSPTVFNGAVYYDLIEPDMISLAEHYDRLEYSLLPGDALHHLPGCDNTLNTGMIDTVGSYGFMMDVSSAVQAEPDNSNGYGEDDFLERFKNVEIYSMDLYVRNIVNASFDVYVRNDGPKGGGSASQRGYQSYSADLKGQTLISNNWELVARGVVEGLGPNVPSPVPPNSWRKNVVIAPGETVGFYVTVKAAPDLRYRNTTKSEGEIYASDGILNVGVGRAWGEFPLRGDGTDVYFSPREFAGAFKYHVHEGLCKSEAPSAAPTFPSVTLSPSLSAAPTREIQHHYADFAEDEGLCPEDDELETTFEDGTGSHGALFDMLAKTNLTLTSVDLNMDWNTGSSAHVLIYARNGSWFGHQNNAEAWPHLIVNTTLYRPQEFHNRSAEGPYISIPTKKESAMIPKGAFKPLRMLMGETWSLYVCTSLADFRYTLGTSIGKTYASNSELRVMEGAGAADYPPFLGGTPENGGVEYTFYAPRLFNGNLHYEYVADCPSASPSIFNFTLVPTPTPTLTTSVTYTFYIEHSPDTLKGAVTYDMRFGVREVLDGFLKEGGEDIMRGLAVNHELVIDKVEANMVSPSDIGYLCYPTPPQTCTPISVNVTATHRATATIDDVTYAFLRQSLHLPGLINVKGYTIEYVGDRAVETNSEITISGVPDREMGETEQEFFASAARSFLEIQAKQGNNTLQILSVTVNGQMITTGESASGQEITTSESGQEITSSESEALQWTTIEHPSTSTSSSSSVMPKMNNSNRRLEKGSNNVKVKVKGKYRPPPEVDLGDFVEDSINSDRELLQKELKKPLALRDESDYFAKAEVVGAREIKEDEPSQKAPTMLGMVVMTDQQEDDSLKDMLNFAAMAVGGLIALLSAAFILRPHRRRVMFGGKNADNRGHRNTQSVDFEDQNLLKKSRAMVRGWGSGSLTNSGTSGASPNDKKAYNLRGSTNSERMLAYSDFSHGQHQGFDPNSSLTSSNRPPFDPHASGTSQMSSANLGASFTRGGGGPNGRHDLSGSFIRGGGGPNGQHQPLNLSGTSGPPVSLQGSFTQGNPAPPPPHYGGGPGGPGPHEPPQPNPFSVPGGADGRPPHRPGRANGLNNSMPPRRHPPPPGGNHPSNSMPPNSMPPMRGGPPGPQRGPMNQSMPPQRGGMGGRRRSSQDSAPPRGLRRPSRDGPPPMRGSVRGSFRVDGHLGMSMPPNQQQQQQQRAPPVTGEGGQRQIHDSRRNQSMRPQHHHR